jgi:hypothetical protein
LADSNVKGLNCKTLTNLQEFGFASGAGGKMEDIGQCGCPSNASERATRREKEKGR